MSPVVRLVLAVLAFVGAFYIVWMLMLTLPFGSHAWIGSLVALAGGAHAARKVWYGTAQDTMSVAVTAGVGALVLGGLGFVAGFFGPMILAPEANQGPMLGIFITGPAGAVIGAIAGAWYAKRRQP
jgi:outer membrane lipoprotein SlyB